MTKSPYIVCPRCGMISHHPMDVTERYCGHCHRYHDEFGFERQAGDVHAGAYFWRAPDGTLERVAPADDTSPDVVICRRVADFPSGQAPAAAGVGLCSRCAAPIAFNTRAPHQERPRICMQCARITPLPITLES